MRVDEKIHKGIVRVYKTDRARFRIKPSTLHRLVTKEPPYSVSDRIGELIVSALGDDMPDSLKPVTREVTHKYNIRRSRNKRLAMIGTPLMTLIQSNNDGRSEAEMIPESAALVKATMEFHQSLINQSTNKLWEG